MDLLIGTNNAGKLREYRNILAGLPLRLLRPADLGLDLDVAETGTTFAENAILKARAFAQAGGHHAVADDSGLCVDALDGRPGLHSARYGGAGLDDAGRRRRLLAELADVDERSAHFVCVIALAPPDSGDPITVEGRCEGRIMRAESAGQYGFGYDPIFQPDGYDVSFAQLPPAEKDRISHRGRAARKLIPILREMLSGS